jgi:hypothetical protein
MKTALSTLKGKHGTKARKTEVPRTTLLDALERETQLLNTEEISLAAGSEPFELHTIEI